jgi:hypothetical protein
MDFNTFAIAGPNTVTTSIFYNLAGSVSTTTEGNNFSARSYFTPRVQVPQISIIILNPKRIKYVSKYRLICFPSLASINCERFQRKQE